MNRRSKDYGTIEPIRNSENSDPYRGGMIYQQLPSETTKELEELISSTTKIKNKITVENISDKIQESKRSNSRKIPDPLPEIPIKRKNSKTNGQLSETLTDNKNQIIAETNAVVKVALLNLLNNRTHFNTHAVYEIINLIKRHDVEKNSIGEDIELLTILTFDGINFQCSVCKIACACSTTMQENHLKSHLHAKNVKSLIKPPIYEKLLQNPFSQYFFDHEVVRKSFNSVYSFNPNPEEFTKQFQYGDTYRNIASLENDGNSVMLEFELKSQTIINDRHFESYYGEAFIKPASGFRCCICDVVILKGTTRSISNHVCSKEHQNRLKRILIKKPPYIALADKSLIKELVNSEKEKIVRIFDKNKLKKISFSPDSKIERKENNEYLKPQSDTKIHKIEMNLEKINNEPPPPNHSSPESMAYDSDHPEFIYD